MINFSTTKSHHFNLLFLLLPAMAGALYWLVNSSYFAAEPGLLSLPISIDLIITIPLIYFLMIRKRKISNLTVIPVTVAAMIFGFNILPGDQHQYLDLFYHFVFPLIELSVVGTLGFKTYKTIKAIRKHGKEDPDALAVMRKTTGSMAVSKKVQAILSTEMAFIYYAIISNFKSIQKPREKYVFSYHKENGMLGLISILVFILLAETFIIHILLMKWSIIAAWILTAISLYSLVFLIGHWNASKKRPIILTAEAMKIKFGMFGDMDIPWDKVAAIKYNSNDVEDDETHSFTFLSGHNVIIDLTEPLTLKGLYGADKQVSKIAFFVDDRQAFTNAVQDLKL